MSRQTGKRTLAGLAIGTFLLLSSGMAQAADGVCLALTERIGPAGGLPPHLLSSIALTESGRWDAERREKVAWPWTVTSGGEGQYFPTKAAAIAEVRRLQRKGVENIDVGCMQINLKYHPDAFADLEAAFDPETNVRYAAAFLGELKGRWGSWETATRYYHSADEDRGRSYQQRVAGNHRDFAASKTHFAVPHARTVAFRPHAAVPPPPHVDVGAVKRAEARREAAAWRQKKLAEYLARKAARGDG